MLPMDKTNNLADSLTTSLLHVLLIKGLKQQDTVLHDPVRCMVGHIPRWPTQPLSWHTGPCHTSADLSPVWFHIHTPTSLPMITRMNRADATPAVMKNMMLMW